MLVQFENIELDVVEDQKHDWLLETALVAEGFGVSVSSIRKHKQRNSDELIEGKHFTSVTNSHAGLERVKTYWTKKGIVRLGFFIKSERAKKFRDWAEDLIIKESEGMSKWDMLREFFNKTDENGRLINRIEGDFQLFKTDTNKRLDNLEAKNAEHPKYFQVKGYAYNQKIIISSIEAKRLGMKASKISKEKGITIDKVDDPKYGKINQYHVSVLEEAFKYLDEWRNL